MRTLVILPRIPFPAHDGAAVSMSERLLALVEAGHEVHVFALNTSRHHVDPGVLAGKCASFAVADVNTDVTAVGAMRSIVSPRKLAAFGVPLQASYWIDRFASVAALEQLKKYVHDHGPFERVICETLFTACYGIALRGQGSIDTSCPVLLHAHNVEHRIQQHVAHETHRSWFERLYRQHLADGTKAYETWVLGKVDGVIAVSGLDANLMRTMEPRVNVVTIAPGISIPSLAVPPVQHHELCFLGSLDWVPNVDGARWFAERVLPLVAEKISDVVLHIGGRNPGYDVKALHNGTSIIVHERVDDATEFRTSHGVTVVPVFSGSGVRVKILEAFAAKCPVVSTTLGAEGLPVEHNVHLLIADSAPDAAAACVSLMTDAALAQRLIGVGHQLVQEHFTWRSVVERMDVFSLDLQRSRA